MQDTEKQLQPAQTRELSELVEATRPGLRFAPNVDIFEGSESITVLADMPGVRPENLQVDLREGTLTLQGDVSDPQTEGETEVLREFAPGTFFRQFRLSETIDQERIDAKLIDGVLTLVLPKTRAAVPRQIAVKKA